PERAAWLGTMDRFDARYELGRRLGVGGMAEVYQAHDVLLDRTVAVKVLDRSLAGDDAARARFRREARAAAGLSQRGIVAVHDSGEAAFDAATLPFLVMEYIDGPTLAQVLAQGPVPAARALRIVAEVLDALGYAHQHGIVHRDVKPGNVMLSGSGAV